MFTQLFLLLFSSFFGLKITANFPKNATLFILGGNVEALAPNRIPIAPKKTKDSLAKGNETK